MASYMITIRGRGPAFPFEAMSHERAARDVAADSDFEPHECITIEVRDAKFVMVFEVDTQPPYSPRLLEAYGCY